MNYQTFKSYDETECTIKSSEKELFSGAPFTKHDLTSIPVWISDYIHHKVWDEITYPFPNFNGATVVIWGWIRNFDPHFTGHVIHAGNKVKPW